MHAQPARGSLKRESAVSYAVFVTPALLLLTLCFIVPLGLSVYYSLCKWNGVSTTKEFIGFANYQKVFTDKNFLKTISFTLKFTLAKVVALNVIGLLLAAALTGMLKTTGLLRAAYYMPMIIGGATVGFLWSFLISNFVPVIGKALDIPWLQGVLLAKYDTTFFVLVYVSVWQHVGIYMLLYLAGLQGIPGDVIEASVIDGCGAVKRFFLVRLPLLRPTVTTCLFLSLLNGLKSFDLNYALTMGGPYGTTKTIAFQIYIDAFQYDRLSYASAEAVLFCIAATMIGLLQVYFTSRKEVEM